MLTFLLIPPMNLQQLSLRLLCLHFISSSDEPIRTVSLMDMLIFFGSFDEPTPSIPLKDMFIFYWLLQRTYINCPFDRHAYILLVSLANTHNFSSNENAYILSMNFISFSNEPAPIVPLIILLISY